MSGEIDKHLNSSDLMATIERLKLRAASVAKGDELQMIALVDEIQRIRAKLVRGRDRVAKELERAAARDVAIAAYARGARSGRNGRH
ncbi:hypothetical protein [Rhodopseudomonas sp. B29]|uniref:hypothetical protein n=1 Tax=Rhodopseudomonas sp. B29 TaxID=95607 RepID=UPI000344EFD3|nr:hypothetical protein [Rhodopseudomonas sp. B29]